jgi:hypothetical protein
MQLGGRSPLRVGASGYHNGAAESIHQATFEPLKVSVAQ